MTPTQRGLGGGRSWNLTRVSEQILLFLNNRFVHFNGWWRWGVKNLIIFVDVINGSSLITSFTI